MAFPTKLPNIPTKATLPKGFDLNELFRPATRKVKNIAGQKKVPAPRVQILIEELRKNPNGVHNQFINMDMQAQSHLLQELGEAFPPARPDQFISPAGQEIVNFLQTGEGIDSTPQRMKILTQDYFDGMREGKVKGKQQPFPTEDAGDAAVDYNDPATSEILPGQEGAKVEDIALANKPPRYVQAHKDAVTRLGWRDRLDSPNSRPIERRVDVFENQPVSTALPEHKSNNISTSEAREKVNTDGAEWDIYENRSTTDPYSSASDYRVAADAKSFQDSVDDWLNSLLNNSNNPESLGANNGNIDDLIALVANKKQPINRNPNRLTANSEKDLRLFFDSPDAAADALTSYFSPKMLLEMSDSTPIGSPQLPGSVRAKASLDDVQQTIKRKLLNRFSEKGWGAKSAEDLSNPAVLDPLDNANSVELGDATTATGNVNQGRPLFNSGEKKGGDGGPLRVEREGIQDQVLEDVAVKEDIAADIEEQGRQLGWSDERVMQEKIDNEVDPASINNYLVENVGFYSEFGNVSKKPGTSPLRSKVESRRKTPESIDEEQKGKIRDAIKKAKSGTDSSDPVKQEPLNNGDGSRAEELNDGLEGARDTPIVDDVDPLTYTGGRKADNTDAMEAADQGKDYDVDDPQNTKPVDDKPADQSPPKGQEEKPAGTNQNPPPKDPQDLPPKNDGNDGNVTPAPKKPGLLRKAAGYAVPTAFGGGGLIALLALMNREGTTRVDGTGVDGTGGAGTGGAGTGGVSSPSMGMGGGYEGRAMTPEEEATLMARLSQRASKFNHNTQNMKSWVR